MVKLNKIYTRTGDDGSTGLVDGTRLSKDSDRVAAYGDVDETNAVLGLARLELTHMGLDRMLGRIQNELFDLGADLATPLPAEGDPDSEYALRIVATQVERLETDLDALNDEMNALTSFILPGGSPPAAYLHQARTVARRAERSMVRLAEHTAVNPQAMAYINRLSDFLFVAARWCNEQGAGDILWVPGATRQPSA
ncbi:cob(I)yrinic acid a,c-diamide adenosyltransferase [Algimonas porphyrae]|uniref:Corrinoid adenosyltransferase n=1 Tax=Algimonas porphyrae TaxID=1128113 RepID=A0ABQ5V5X5_9PROT|nr:cob(I)yrinic acid a,c-diamide adenosyltransferase [Algimonas porphyrae]GLQ22070.1 cob(I)yrinic acid a,c-diamide adenosyltransferase [Algimonas porphyrae]